MTQLNSEEAVVLMALVNTFNLFLELDVEHEDDAREFANAIHVCQNIIMARPTLRYLLAIQNDIDNQPPPPYNHI